MLMQARCTLVHTHTRVHAHARAPASCPVQGAIRQPRASLQARPVTLGALEASNALKQHVFLTPGIWPPLCLLGREAAPGGGAGTRPRWNHGVYETGH